MSEVVERSRNTPFVPRQVIVPEGYEIGLVEPDDAEAMVEIHARGTWEAWGHCIDQNNGDRQMLHNFMHDPGGLVDRQRERLGRIACGEQIDPAAELVVRVIRRNDTRRLVGFCIGRKPHEYKASQDWLAHIDTIEYLYVDRSEYGSGVGSAVFAAVMSRLGFAVALSTVKGTPAVKYYENRGFKQIRWPVWRTVRLFINARMRLPEVVMYCYDNPYYQYPQNKDPDVRAGAVE